MLIEQMFRTALCFGGSVQRQHGSGVSLSAPIPDFSFDKSDFLAYIKVIVHLRPSRDSAFGDVSHESTEFWERSDANTPLDWDCDSFQCDGVGSSDHIASRYGHRSERRRC